jgi:hypothetical protein
MCLVTKLERASQQASRQVRFWCGIYLYMYNFAFVCTCVCLMLLSYMQTFTYKESSVLLADMDRRLTPSNVL